MNHVMVFGTSEPQDFQLLDDGAALDGTGFDIEIEWRGSVPPGPPVAAWLVVADGTVRVTQTSQIPIGAYLYRWKLTDGLGRVGYVPNMNQLPDTWKVVRA
jgi:hypothetical protein